MTEVRAMSCKELRDYYGVGRKAFKRWIKVLPDDLRALIPATNAIMPPATIEKLRLHWGER